MAKGWDTFDGNKQYAAWCEQWARECLRVLKPGGYLLAFSGTRTYHALAWGVESAGFEIRDMIEWLYLSGFPKSMDVGKQFDKMSGAEREVIGVREDFAKRANKQRIGVSWADNTVKDGSFSNPQNIGQITAPATPLAKQWDGWGTALKPAHEPIVMARKPLSGTVCANVEQYGTGALNVDGCRIAYAEGTHPRELYGESWMNSGKGKTITWNGDDYTTEQSAGQRINDNGRFPANCITTDDDAWYSKYFNVTPQEISKKASKKDRNSDWRGNEIELPERAGFTEQVAQVRNKDNYSMKLFCVQCGKRSDYNCGCGAGFEQRKQPGLTRTMKNNHPTVKPTDLMAWLIRLVTPPSGIVLDPFAGSGTTLVAAKRLGFQYIGIESELDYVHIAESRLT